MSKLRWGIAAALAVGLFAFGALGPLRSRDSVAEPRLAAGDIAAPLIGGKDLDRAIQMLQRRVRAEPDDARSLALLGLAYVNRARISFDPSYYPKAASVLRRALEIEARSFEATLGMGTLALARHDFAEGLRWGRLAKKINPYSAEARGVIG
ncbi:MAG: tetratricopeptide repeat protein, partial [Actinomycetota bacterium]